MQEGKILSYIETKGYGFIAGNNGKKYFFHISNVNEKEPDIVDNTNVSFNEVATEKGYSATDINLLTNISTQDNGLYEAPETIYISKEDSVKGWKTLEKSQWAVKSSDKDLDTAKEEIIDYASLLGGNALVNYRYSKSRGSESTSGGGTYYYTVHNFYGEVVNIGKPSLNGVHKTTDFNQINETALYYWESALAKTVKSFRYGRISLFLAFLGALYLYFFTLPVFDIHFFSHAFSNMTLEKDRNLISLGFGIFFIFIIIRKIFYNNYANWLQPLN